MLFLFVLVTHAESNLIHAELHCKAAGSLIQAHGELSIVNYEPFLFDFNFLSFKSVLVKLLDHLWSVLTATLTVKVVGLSSI